jgi:hypothetical protein
MHASNILHQFTPNVSTAMFPSLPTLENIEENNVSGKLFPSFFFQGLTDVRHDNGVTFAPCPICQFTVFVKHVVLNVNPTGIKIMRSSFEQAVGDAPKRAYHSSVLFQRELLVLGGIFPNPGPQPDVCSNELYIFNAGNFELR